MIEWKQITDGCEAYNGEEWLVGRRSAYGHATIACSGQFLNGMWWLKKSDHYTPPTHYAPLTPIPESKPDPKLNPSEAKALLWGLLVAAGFDSLLLRATIEGKLNHLTNEELTKVIKEATNA
jgi:hypothetical protein